MNDRFKFRVFGLCCNSKLEKNWVNITEVGKFFIDKDGKLIDASAYFDPINHPEYFIIEQCTGLKDNCGNLIYEGDIIGDGEDDYVIKWDSNRTMFVAEDVDTSYEIEDVLDPTICVIGNIHEQAEQKE